MKVTIKVKKEFDLKQLLVNANVRYWEDATVNGVEDTNGASIPCRNDNYWSPIIEIETGQIVNWSAGTTAYIHYKVCDGCGWGLQDVNGEVVLFTEDGYVPDTLCPEGNGYGDYIWMRVNENGVIQNWEFNISDFTEDDEE